MIEDFIREHGVTVIEPFEEAQARKKWDLHAEVDRPVEKRKQQFEKQGV